MQLPSSRSYASHQKGSPSPLGSKRVASKGSEQMLCKIAFEIDEQQQELFIYEGSNIQMATNQLIDKLSLSHFLKTNQEIDISQDERQTLKNQIKQKIQLIIETCIDTSPKTIRWKNKLRKFILSHSNIVKKPDIQQNTTPRNIKYFEYNPIDNQISTSNRSVKIIQRAKIIQNSLEKIPANMQNYDPKHRLYDQGKRINEVKKCLSKMRQQSIENQQLAQCTFQPKMIKAYFKPLQTNLDKNNRNVNVFARLYKQALNKQQKMKIIKKQIEEKQVEQTKDLNFTPLIDSCSRQIAQLQRQVSRSQNKSVYDDLYRKVPKKQQKQVKNQHTFKPTICPKSNQIARKAKVNYTSRQIKTKQNNSFIQYSPLKYDTNKSQSKLSKQRSHFLNRYKFLNTNSTEKSPISKRKILEQMTSNNRSCRIKTDVSSQENNFSKRFETCQNQFLFNNSKGSYQCDQNSLFDTRENSKKIKMKDNLFFLISEKDQNMNIADKLLHSKKQKTAASTNQSLKFKKPKINPYDFFKIKPTKSSNSSHHHSTYEPKTTAQNKQMNLQTKNQMFDMIFQLFDKNNIGEVTAQSILNNQEIPQYLKSVFYPMADEMRQLNVGLDKEQFTWSLLRIFEKLSKSQHQSFMQWKDVLTDRY